MTFFNIEIDPKDVAAAKFIADTQRGLVSEAIKAKERDNSLTRAEIARIAGIDKSSLTKILNGKGNITLRKLAEIAYALGVEPSVGYASINRQSNSGSRNRYQVNPSSGRLQWEGGDNPHKHRSSGGTFVARQDVLSDEK